MRRAVRVLNNADGIRTEKIVNGIKHEYYLNGSQIIREVVYSANGTYIAKDIRYFYDGEGSPVALRYFTFNSAGTTLSDTTYYLGTNVQGDVTGIYDASGNLLYTYLYDAWGNLIQGKQISTGGNAAAEINPFRYRGYYFDSETGYYYLNSRYYNSQWGRFLNADGELAGIGEDILGYNLYAYCRNNPVNMTDSHGNWPRWITAAVAITTGTIAVLAALTGNAPLAVTAAKACIVASTVYAAQIWHYDVRAEKNASMENTTYDQVTKWTDANTQVKDTFHDFSGDNNKVCFPDGREGVYNKDQLYVTDPRDIATYNYFDPKGFWGTLGHIVIDVTPYLIFGNNDKDPGFIINFAEKGIKKLFSSFD